MHKEDLQRLKPYLAKLGLTDQEIEKTLEMSFQMVNDREIDYKPEKLNLAELMAEDVEFDLESFRKMLNKEE